MAITLALIIAAVEHFAQDRSVDRRVSAQSVDNFIENDFVINLQLFRKVLTLSLYSENYLQDEHIDIRIAIDHIDTLRMSLGKICLMKSWIQRRHLSMYIKSHSRSKNVLEVIEMIFHADNARVCDKSD